MVCNACAWLKEWSGTEYWLADFGVPLPACWHNMPTKPPQGIANAISQSNAPLSQISKVLQATGKLECSRKRLSREVDLGPAFQEM